MFRCMFWMALLSVVPASAVAQDLRVTMGRFDSGNSEAEAAASVSLEVRFSGESIPGFDGGLAERHRLRIANRSPNAILMVVYKHLCADPDRAGEEANWTDCGTSKAYFHMAASPRYQPIEPGRTRDLDLVLSTKRSSQVRIVPICILFEDGTSIGKREPYASKYLDMIKPMAEYFRSLSPGERARLSAERRTRLSRITDMALAIASRSSQIEKDAGIPRKN